MRGRITKQLQDKAFEILGRETTELEIRLMVYVHYTMCNEQRLNPSKISSEERPLLTAWREMGWLTGGASDMQITNEFWDIMCDLIWIAYVVQPGGELETIIETSAR